MAPLRGCDVSFRIAAAAPDRLLQGQMQKGRCRFPALDDPTREICSWSQVTKSPDVFSYKDGWFNPDGTVYRSWTKDWFVFEKR